VTFEPGDLDDRAGSAGNRVATPRADLLNDEEFFAM
jgi:hypothetical protein